MATFYCPECDTHDPNECSHFDTIEYDEGMPFADVVRLFQDSVAESIYGQALPAEVIDETATSGPDSDEYGKPPPWFLPKVLFLMYGYVLGPIEFVLGFMFYMFDRFVIWIMDRPASGCCGCGAAYCDAKVYPGLDGRGESYCWTCLDTIPGISHKLSNPNVVRVYKGRERQT